jgi:PmbA protein
MLPDDALERLMESARAVAKVCESNSLQQWEVVGEQDYGHSIDLEAGRIALAAGGGSGGLGLRVVEDGRYGYAHLADASGAQRAVKEALSIARKSPSIAGFELPVDTGSATTSGLIDRRIIDMSSEDILEQADEILSSVTALDSRAVVTGGGLGAGAGAEVIINSNGIEDGGIHTSHGFGIQVGIDEDDQLTSAYEGSSSRSRLSDIEQVVERAVHWAQITRNTIDSGEVSDCPVLMTAEGFSPLFSMVVPSALIGERMAQGESFWSNRMGEKVIADHLSIVDDRIMAGGMSSSSRDSEGAMTRRQTLVDCGRLQSSLWSTRDACRMMAEGKIEHAQTTGSASRGGYQSPPGVGCGNLLLQTSQKTHSRDSLIEEMDEGYIVHSVMGAHTANPTSGDFSVTTSMVLRVEQGEIIGALKQAGLSGNIGKALVGELLLGDEVRCHGSYSSGSMYLPDVLLKRGLRINPA